MNFSTQMTKYIINKHDITTDLGEREAFDECIEFIDCIIRHPLAIGDAKEALRDGLNML